MACAGTGADPASTSYLLLGVTAPRVWDGLLCRAFRVGFTVLLSDKLAGVVGAMPRMRVFCHDGIVLLVNGMAGNSVIADLASRRDKSTADSGRKDTFIGQRIVASDLDVLKTGSRI